MTNYLLAGGGTAGHVNPLLALADEIRRSEPDAGITVLGTAEGLESRLVPQRGYELVTIPKVPFPRRLNRSALAFPKRFLAAKKQIVALLADRQIDVVVGFGGYAAAPAYRAAKSAKVPSVVHEANTMPGLANIWGARSAAKVGVAFADTDLRGARFVGMPLRSELAELDRVAAREEAFAYFGLDPARKTLVVFGGSLGARSLNNVFSDSGEQAWRLVVDSGWQLLHAFGAANSLSDPGNEHYRMVPYIDRMDLAYSVADAVLSRSGAATVAELLALQLPAIYVPYPVGNGEQAKNAAESVRSGAALLIPDAALSAQSFRSEVLPVLADPDRLAAMAGAAADLGDSNGAASLLALVHEALEQ